jgi:hypothetical protein
MRSFRVGWASLREELFGVFPLVENEDMLTDNF